MKQAFIKNYNDDNIDDHYNFVPSPEIEVETWTPKKKLKRKKITYTLYKQKLIKSKKWVPAKSRKIITERNQRKRKKTSIPNKKGDQGCPSKKKNEARKHFQKYPKRAY